MHKEILNQDQLLPLLKKFKREFYLVGGTAKAYALGRRAKWKDYVDMYFIIKNHYTIKEISGKAEEIFGDLFSEKLFRAQLSYFEDIDYSEPVEYLVNAPDNEEIKTFLVERAIEL